MTQQHYNLTLISGDIREIEPETSGTSSKGTEWRRRKFSITSKYSWGKKKVFFITLWNEQCSLLADKCAGEHVTVIGQSVSTRSKSGKWFDSIEALTVFGKGEGLPDLNELYNAV